MKIFHALFRNLPAKIVCLALALGLWIYVGTGQAKIGNFPGDIPLEVRNVPQGLVAVTDIEAVSIKIVAGATIWKSLGAGSFSASIDLTGAQEGTLEVPVKVTTNIEGVRVVEVEPSKVLVRLEKITQKEVPVTLLVEGKAAEGFVVGDWKIKPDRVEVSGAASIIDEILEATVKVVLSGEKETINKVVRVAGLDANGQEIKNLEFKPAEVQVEIPLVEASSAKTVGIKVITTGQPAQGYWISKIESEPSSVTITASAGLINQISFLETREVDISGINQDRELVTFLKPNPGVIIFDDVSIIKLKIAVSQTPSTKQIQAGFSWKNLADYLKVVSADPSLVTVVVTGSTNDLAALKPGQVSVNVDLSSIKAAGTYSVDISRSNISTPMGISFSSVVPSAVDVRIESR